MIVVGLRASGRASERVRGHAGGRVSGAGAARLRFGLSVRLRFSHRLFRKVTEWRGGTVIGRGPPNQRYACYSLLQMACNNYYWQM